MKSDGDKLVPAVSGKDFVPHEDTNWLKATNNNGFTGEIFYRRKNGIVYVSFGSIRTRSQINPYTGTILAVLPEDFRPDINFHLAGCTGANGIYKNHTFISADGKINVWSSDTVPAGEEFSAAGAYPV